MTIMEKYPMWFWYILVDTILIILISINDISFEMENFVKKKRFVAGLYIIISHQ